MSCGEFSEDFCNRSPDADVLGIGPSKSATRRLFHYMFRKNFDQKRLDRVGQTVVRASVLSDEEAGQMASAPFLLARIKTRISDTTQAEGAGGIWANFALISPKAITIMSLAAVFSLGLFVYTGNNSAKPAFSVDAYLGTSESRVEQLVFAERQPVTVDEVLATIVAKDEREPAR